MSMKDHYGTSDMGLGIALQCRGYILTEIEQSSSKRVTFKFKVTNGIYEAIQAYWNGKLSVDAKTYWNESKNLKTRLYSLK